MFILPSVWRAARSRWSSFCWSIHDSRDGTRLVDGMVDAGVFFFLLAGSATEIKSTSV